MLLIWYFKTNKSKFCPYELKYFLFWRLKLKLQKFGCSKCCYVISVISFHVNFLLFYTQTFYFVAVLKYEFMLLLHLHLTIFITLLYSHSFPFKLVDRDAERKEWLNIFNAWNLYMNTKIIANVCNRHYKENI